MLLQRRFIPLPKQSRFLLTLRKKPSENIVRKGENADKQHFLLLPQCFLLYQRKITTFNSLTIVLNYDKILDWSKLKAVADNKINVTEELKFVLGRVENIGGKREYAGYQHFILFPQCFQKPSYTGSSKVVIVS